MWLLPLAAALVAASFTASLARRFPERRSPAIALWAMALAMYAVGCLALAVGVARGFDPSTFRLYWIFGAVLNVPFRLIFAYNPQREGVLKNTLLPAQKFQFRFAVGTTF